ncbi:MAG: PilZ domain-containing protein [Acidobacteriales bacterium]|nr:PilZ domain-containing protein [Terriglobales bacterium]
MPNLGTDNLAVDSKADSKCERRWPRYSVNVPIRVIVKTEMKSSIFDGRGTSLSEGGMEMFAGTELHVGDQVGVEFTPAYSAPPVRVAAKVRHRSGYTYGLEFLTGSERQMQEVTQLKMHLSSMVGAARA